MKRFAALLLAALMALTAFSAVAEDYTLAEKFYQQAVKESAYRGTVTFAVTGDATQMIDGTLWQTLKALAPRMSLSLEHATAPNKDEGQATLTLTLDGQTSAKHTFMYEDNLIAFGGTLLGGDEVYYAADRAWNVGEMLESALNNTSEWPSMWRVIGAIAGASQEWKMRAQDRVTLYETKLGLWLNSYASFSTGRENGVTYSQLACTIPAQAVKAEIKQLMVDLYADGELLSLLREVVTAREAAAYLDPTLMNTLFSMIDNLNLNGDVQVIRRYDTTGSALLDSVTLPFSDSGLINELTLSVIPETNGSNWEIRGRLMGGTDVDVTCFVSDAMIYTGSAVITLPESAEGFVVSDSNDRQTIAFDYNLDWEPGEDTYTLATDRFTRPIKGSLLIRPKEGTALPEQSLTLDMTMSSGSSKRSATQLNGSLTWRDLDSGASVSAVLTSRTVSPFAYQKPSSLTGAMRLDQLAKDSLTAVVQSWLTRAAAYFTSLTLNAAGLHF